MVHSTTGSHAVGIGADNFDEGHQRAPLQGKHHLVMPEVMFDRSRGDTHNLLKRAGMDNYRFHLESPEELQPTSLNTLYVQPVASPLLTSPLVCWLIETLRETRELLRPVARLGLPDAPIQAKLPYYG